MPPVQDVKFHRNRVRRKEIPRHSPVPLRTAHHLRTALDPHVRREDVIVDVILHRDFQNLRQRNQLRLLEQFLVVHRRIVGRDQFRVPVVVPQHDRLHRRHAGQLIKRHIAEIESLPVLRREHRLKRVIDQRRVLFAVHRLQPHPAVLEFPQPLFVRRRAVHLAQIEADRHQRGRRLFRVHFGVKELMAEPLRVIRKNQARTAVHFPLEIAVALEQIRHLFHRRQPRNVVLLARQQPRVGGSRLVVQSLERRIIHFRGHQRNPGNPFPVLFQQQNQVTVAERVEPVQKLPHRGEIRARVVIQIVRG